MTGLLYFDGTVYYSPARDTLHEAGCLNSIYKVQQLGGSVTTCTKNKVLDFGGMRKVLQSKIATGFGLTLLHMEATPIH